MSNEQASINQSYLHLTIVTPNRRVASEVKAKFVTLPGEKGQLTILPGHAHLIGKITTGIVNFETNEGEKKIAAVSFGFLEVFPDKCILMVDTFEMPGEINLERAKLAQKKASEKLSAAASFEQDMVKWQRKLERSQNRIAAAQFLLAVN